MLEKNEKEKERETMSTEDEEFQKEMHAAHEKIGMAVYAYFGVAPKGSAQAVPLSKLAAALVTLSRLQTFLTETMVMNGMDREHVLNLINQDTEADQKVICDLLEKEKPIYDEQRKKNQWASKKPSIGG